MLILENLCNDYLEPKQWIRIFREDNDDCKAIYEGTVEELQDNKFHRFYNKIKQQAIYTLQTEDNTMEIYIDGEGIDR